MEQLSEAQGAAWIHRILKANFTQRDPSATVPEPVEFILTRWESDPHSYGSYSYFPTDPECSPLDMIELSRPLYDGRLGFAGEATHCDLYASVHGVCGLKNWLKKWLKLRKKIDILGIDHRFRRGGSLCHTLGQARSATGYSH